MTNVYHKSPEIIVEVPEERTDELAQTTDDLTKINGIGPGTAEKLNAMRIYTYRQLAELTPERLSEAPGVGIATARKFIDEAKNLLGEFQEQNSIDKQNHVIEKTTEILKKEKESEVDNNETFEVAEVIVEEELPQESFQREEIPIETIQKQWFSDKLNRSRLTASYPAVSKRSSKESKVEMIEIEEIESETETKNKPEVEERKEEEIEEYQEIVPEDPIIPEQLKNNTIVEPFESVIPFPEELIPREQKVVIPILTEPPEVTKIVEVEVPKTIEVQKVPEVPEVLKIPEIIEIPTRPRALNRHEELTNEVVESLKELGYYKIPSGTEALAPFFQNIDYIGLKLVSVNDNAKLIVLAPVKLCDLEGTILVHEDKIDYKAYSKAQVSNLIPTARHYADALLKAKEGIFEDIVNGENFQEFFEKYLQVKLTVEKSSKNKKLYFVSGQGQTQYKVLIEPILLTKIPAKCMEKSILYPYQRKSNLHVIDKSNIGHLLRFLEKKYKLIESHAKKTNSIEKYQNADNKFRSNLRIASIPFLGYSVVLLVIYFSQLNFLLRLLNSIGVAAIGIYVFAIAYFYFKFYNTKKELTTEFETPYYLQNAQFSETDLLIVREEFTSEQMTQFGYECFGKANDFKVLEQNEKDRIKENIETRQQNKNASQFYELDSEPEHSSIGEKPKKEIKYSSFLED